MEGFATYYELTGDRAAYDALLQGVAKLVETNRWSGSALSSIAFVYGQTGDPKQRGLLLRAMKGTDVYSLAGSGGNNLRNAGYLFWYLTKDLPKKLEVEPLNF
jgi:hypothetical protein